MGWPICASAPLFKESFKDMLQELLEQFVDDWLAAV